MKLHHIGIAVKSIDRQQAALTEQFGAAPVGEPVYDPIQDATLRMYALPDGTQIELVEGDSVKNCVRGGQKSSIYHLCFETDDLDGQIASMVTHGAVLFREPAPAVLFADRRVAFLHTKVMMVELLER